MDLLDEIAVDLQLDPDLLFQLRRRYGGEKHYIRSARSEIRHRIRTDPVPVAVIAERYQVHRNSVYRIRRP